MNRPSRRGGFPRVCGSEIHADALLEVRPTGPNSGEVVWEWRLWDHLVQEDDSTKANYGKVAEHPELMDMNFDKDYSAG